MTGLLTADYLREYARRPINLVLLVVIPVIFVIMAGGTLAEFARLLGGQAGTDQLQTLTAGWAAAFIAGVAGFFHVTGSRESDRRVALAGAGAGRVVAARLGSGLLLALLASAAGLAALAIRSDVTELPRALGATLMFVAVYLALGSAVGALVRSEVNGSLLIVFIWLFDLFLGPAMGSGGDTMITRVFPTHFPTLVMLNTPSGYAGPLGDLGMGLAWVAGSVLVATILLVRTTRPAVERAARTLGGWRRTGTALRFGFTEYRRNTALWVLLVFLPVAFITLSFYVTPSTPSPVEVTSGGRAQLVMLPMADIHGAIMVPITAAFLTGLAGLFVVVGSAEADRRLVLAGFRTREVLTARMAIIAAAGLLTTGVSLAVTAYDFTPAAWLPFAAANLLVALTYGMIGVLVGPLVGRLGGLYVMFLIPFLDVGLAQNVMFSAAPPSWARFAPGYGAVRVLVDGAFTADFDETRGLLLALAWFAAITVAALVVFHRLARPRAG